MSMHWEKHLINEDCDQQGAWEVNTSKGQSLTFVN